MHQNIMPKLFLYPHFVVDNNYQPTYAEIFNVLKMTEFFLKENFFKFHHLTMPASRADVWRYFDNEDTVNESSQAEAVMVGHEAKQREEAEKHFYGIAV